jgi:hypothetical protein
MAATHRTLQQPTDPRLKHGIGPQPDCVCVAIGFQEFVNNRVVIGGDLGGIRTFSQQPPNRVATTVI